MLSMREARPWTTVAVTGPSMEVLRVAVNAGPARVDIEHIVNDAQTAVLYSLQHTEPHRCAPQPADPWQKR